MSSARELVAAGDPAAALDALQQEVRSRAADPKLRIFLFQLLCVLGQWQRALTQLQLCGELDPATLAMVGTYREALQCEAVREAVFAGKVVPHAFGRPQPWVALLAQALQSEAQGDLQGAQRCRSDALGQAPATGGTLNGEAFEWIADADSRLGPVLEVVINGRYGWVPFGALRRVVVEPPTDLRDLVWAPARLEFPNGGDTVALVPTRYAGSAGSADAALQMARRTDWVGIGPDQFCGLGLRTLVTDRSEVGLLEVRLIELNVAQAPDAVD
jgi:type VI secretion system protein ImpE